MLERNLATMNIHCNFFISVNNFHSHWLRILCGHNRISALLQSVLFSSLRMEPRVIKYQFALIMDQPEALGHHRVKKSGSSQCSSLSPAPLCLQTCHKNPSQLLTNSPHDGQRGAGKVPGPSLMANNYLIFSFIDMDSSLTRLSTIVLPITRIYVLFLWECCSQTAVIVGKGSVKLNPTEVLIVDNSIRCHLLRDICILRGSQKQPTLTQHITQSLFHEQYSMNCLN